MDIEKLSFISVSKTDEIINYHKAYYKKNKLNYKKGGKYYKYKGKHNNNEKITITKKKVIISFD